MRPFININFSMKTAIIIVVLLGVIVATVFWFCSQPVVIRQPHLTFPDDENGDILRQMQAAGDNLDAARDMNFNFVFKVQSDAELFATKATAQDFHAEASSYPASKMWQVVVTHPMMPTHAAITELETRLTKIAADSGGKADGWGSFIQP